MLSKVVLASVVAGAAAFAPASLPSFGRVANKATSPSMQLYGEGKLQGVSSKSLYQAERPASEAFDGTWAGDQGWDPLGISTLIDVRWLREAELKHGRVCMLAATGLLVQDVYQFPGTVATFGDAKVTALHNAAVSQGAMQQLLVWLGFLELFGFVAIVQMLQGSDRQPGDFGFDPLDLAKDQSKFARRQLVELKNGRLAMLGFSGMLVGYQVTGNGPTHPFGP
ncbi:light harvesting complex protein 8 [Baffinella frigidus]|nr:light harvesting complex protein 8 [Cryptophyta sp. CCMP2293]